MIETFPVQTMRIHLEEHMHGTAEQVFAALTTGVALWWSASHLENKALAHDLILEPRLGGRFYESWTQPTSDREGSILGYVIQLRNNDLIKIAGYFGLEEHCAHGVVSIKLHREKPGVRLTLKHDAVGELNEAVQAKMTKSWRELINALKQLVERHHIEGVRHDPALEE